MVSPLLCALLLVVDLQIKSISNVLQSPYLSLCILSRVIHKLVGWDNETVIWWAGACELTFHFNLMLCWVRSPFPPARHGLTRRSHPT